MNRFKLFLCCILLPIAVHSQTDHNVQDGKIHWFSGGHIEWDRNEVKQVANKQDTTKWLSEFRFGIDAGGGISKVFSSNLLQKSQPNASAGLFVNVNYSPLMFETGLRWHRRSYDLKGFIPKYTTTAYRLELNPQYLEIPLSAGMMFGLADISSKKLDVRFGLKLGMYFAVGLLGDGIYHSSDYNSAAESIDNVFKRQSIYNGKSAFDPMKRFDMGGKFGVDIYINRWKIGFEYTRGWTDLNNSYDRHLKTKSFDFKIGFVLGYRRSVD